MEMLPFFALGALGIATFVVASGTRKSALRAEKLGEDRFELLRDQQERLELLREERRVLSEELEHERRERLEAQKRVKQLMREHDAPVRTFLGDNLTADGYEVHVAETLRDAVRILEYKQPDLGILDVAL